jgi:hypothetical protein
MQDIFHVRGPTTGMQRKFHVWRPKMRLQGRFQGLSLIDMTYFTKDTKATPESIFRLMWIWLFHNVVKRVIELREFVVLSVVQTVMEFEWIGCFRLGYVGSTVGKICFVFDLIMHNAYTVDACPLTRILTSLSLKDMTYFTEDTKATPASLQGVGVFFTLICIWLLHNVLNV